VRKHYKYREKRLRDEAPMTSLFMQPSAICSAIALTTSSDSISTIST
jgi:hypothetical protein